MTSNGNNPVTLRLPATGLSRFLKPRQGPPPGSVCDMCGEPFGATHSHVVHVEGRRLMCTCRPCYLLFSNEGAGGGRYRQVPDRYQFDPEFQLTTAQWDNLQIPVDIAFFFHNTELGETVALYPSPGGATESTLPLDAWKEVVEANPELLVPEPDTEAILVRRNEGRFECFLVPIDVCYELVGRVRLKWKGFDGGQELWADLRQFFDTLHERAAGRLSGH
ncbi:MAG: DUF5947 family protein [Acidimicrobiia bacterium]